MAIRAVLFDLGHTLWHIPEPPPVEAVRNETVRRILQQLRSWGIEPEERHRFLGRDIRLAVEAAVTGAYESDLREPDYAALARTVAAAKGLSLTREQGEDLWETWNLGGAFFGRRLFDDAIDTLATLRERGYRLGSVTNRSYAGPSFVAEVEEHGLVDLFEVIAVSCDLGYMKPHPEIFQHALDAMGIGPEETVMVGDSLFADVAGAQALGMTAIWRRRPDTREQVDGVRPDFVVDELRQIPQLPCFG